MSNHKPVYLSGKGEHWVQCKTCGFRSGLAASTQEAEDLWLKHLEYIERVKAHLGTQTPSLKQQRDYFLDQARNDPDEKHRPVWQQLADELSGRLGDKAPKWEQPELMDF